MSRGLFLLIFLGLFNQVAQCQKLLSPEELKDDLDKRLKQLSAEDSIFFYQDPGEVHETYKLRNLDFSSGMPIVQIGPQLVDQNRILLKNLDWKAHNMPIKDPRGNIGPKDP